MFDLMIHYKQYVWHEKIIGSPNLVVAFAIADTIGSSSLCADKGSKPFKLAYLTLGPDNGVSGS